MIHKCPRKYAANVRPYIIYQVILYFQPVCVGSTYGVLSHAMPLGPHMKQWTHRPFIVRQGIDCRNSTRKLNDPSEYKQNKSTPPPAKNVEQ